MTTTLQEFLVSLKYKQEGGAKFISDLDGVGSKVAKLGALVATTMTGVSLAVGKYALNLEQLKFVADRTNTTVKNLRSLQMAGASLGSSAEGAKSSLEGLSKFMRNTPASSNFLEGIGVKTKDAKGHALDTVEIMKNLGGAFRKMPQYMASQYAGMLGISDNMELALRSGDFDAEYKKYQSTLKGGHIDETAKSAHNTGDKIRVLGLEKEKFLSITNKHLLDAFNAADTATHGLSTEAGAAALALADLAGTAFLAKKGLELLFGKGAPAAAAAGGEAVAAAGGVGLITLGATGAGLMLYSPTLGTGQGKITDEQWANRPAEKPVHEVSGLIKQSPGHLARGLRNNNPGNLNFTGAPGESLESGAKPRFARYGSMDAGLIALARQLHIYDSRGNNTIAGIIGKYAPPGENNTKKYIKDLAASMGVSANSRLDMKNPQVVAGLMGGITRLEGNGSFDKGRLLADAKRGMTVNTNITVNGSSDPLATAKAVASAQRRTFQLAARNTVGITR